MQKIKIIRQKIKIFYQFKMNRNVQMVRIVLSIINHIKMRIKKKVKINFKIKRNF